MRYCGDVLYALMALFVGLAAAPAQALTSVPFGGVIATHSGKCISVEAASGASGARVLQASCRHAGSDQWQVQPNGSYYQVIDQLSGLCLAITGASKTQGAQVVQTTCATSDSQLWTITAQGSGYALKVKNSGMCLDVYGASQADAATLIQWGCSGSANQTFQFERKLFIAQLPAAIVGTQSGQCVAVSGSTIVQAPCTGGTGNDSWKLTPVGTGYNVVSVQSGKCLDVTGASKTAGAAVIPWTCSGATNQQWRLQAYNNAWRLVAVHSGQCLVVNGGGTSAGTGLVQNTCSGVTNELWSLHVPKLVATWSGVTATQVDPVAAANLPSGKVLAWSAEQTLSFGGGPSGQTYTEVLDPVAKTESVFLVANTGHDMFCPGTAVLPDGRVLVNGGIDSTRTSLFDPVTTTWSASAAMNIGRGYQGTVLAADGSVFTLGGSWSGGAYGGRTGELWTEAGGWKLLSGVPADPVLTADAQGAFRSDNHLWLNVLSGQRLLQSGPSKQMNWIVPSANNQQGSITSAGLRGDDADSMDGNAALYDVDQILKAGGSPSYQNVNATTSALLINAAGSSPAIKRIAPMAYARAFATAVVLPTAQVLIVGGQTYPVPFSDDNAILVPELWDPASQVFERLPAMATPRVYHSVALLLPDARVWVAGGGLCGTCTTNHANYEIITPPYLLNDDGTLATRPAISAVSPATPVLGATLQVTTGTPVTGFALMRLSSVTHTVNNDQRRIPLAASTTDGKLYTMTLSTDPGVLVPGYYMLFAMNAKGVPSAAYTLRIAAK